MKKLTIFFLLFSSASMAQSIQAWVGSPYYLNLENQLNFQVGGMFKINSKNNHFGLGLEYATKNITNPKPENYDVDFYSREIKYELPQLNLIARYEYQFLLNEKNRLGVNVGGTISFMFNNSSETNIWNQKFSEDLKNGTGVLGRTGIIYYRSIAERISLFAEIYGQYKIIQDLNEYGSSYYTGMIKSPKDYFSAGLNLGVEISLAK